MPATGADRPIVLVVAVALIDATEVAAGEPVIFVSRDLAQAAAARALGLETA